jgi:L-Ala-D/L-Glu epimerase
MQITRAEVIPITLTPRKPVQLAHQPPIDSLTAIFVRLERRQGQTAWGCTVAHPVLTGDDPAEVLRQCREAAALAPDLHPLNLEYTLDELAARTQASPAALCAFDLAYHDLLGLAAGMPLYRVLGGYRDRIQTSVTLPLTPLDECVELACRRAGEGFRMLKVKGGMDPDGDVERVLAIHRLLPNHVLRLDADGGYTGQQAIDVARALQDCLEMLEQPTPPEDYAELRRVKEISPIPILADQSLKGPASALELVSGGSVDGLSINISRCGGLRCARQVDAIGRAAHLRSMVSCYIEPSLLTCAGLSLALSSPNVAYGDLDGFLGLDSDPSRGGFTLQDGWLIASEVPGLGYTVDLG